MLAAALSAHVELARRERERADEAGMLRRLGELTSRLARISDAADLERDLCAAARDLAGADGAILWTAARGGMLRAAAAIDWELAGTELPPGHGSASRYAFDHGERIYRGRDELLGIAGWGAALFEPLVAGARPVGVLTVFWDSEPPQPPERELELIGLLASEAAVAIERTTTFSELEKLTRVDALTGLGNRRAFDEQLARELKRAEREGTPLALAMFDLDHFKTYNDTHGHPEGDRLLTEIAANWQGCLRATDSVARYGGEEFALIAPGCVEAEAVGLVDRLRDAVPRGQTCSAGVAMWDGAESAGRAAGPRRRRALRRQARRPQPHPRSLVRGELLQHPLRAERRAPVRAPVDQHVVARAQVHRQVALDRIPVVVLGDQLVERVEAAALGERAPALGEQRVVVPALLAQRPVRAREPALLGGDRLVDLGDPLHPARAHAGLEVGLHGPLGHPRLAGDRLPEAGARVEILLDQAFRGTAVHRGLILGTRG